MHLSLPSSSHTLASHGVVGDLIFFWPMMALLAFVVTYSWREWRKERREAGD